MNYEVLYQWNKEITTHLPCLNSWQAENVALFSTGIIQAESCQQEKVAKQIVTAEKVDSAIKRWRRFLSNDKFPTETCCIELTRWIVASLNLKRVYLLVDETKLQDRFGAMVVGIAWQNRCLPVAWKLYVAADAEAYPAGGQVKLIETLLTQVKQGLDADQEVILLADRGIGNSSALCDVVTKLGWHFLFRVTARASVTINGHSHTISKMVQEGETWHGYGHVFKSNGNFLAHAIAIWETGHKECWTLITSCDEMTGYEYAQRNWQEQSFRDLKSGGWFWSISRIRKVEHMSRLLFLLALSYGWCVALGSVAHQQGVTRKLIKDANGNLRRHISVFKEGLRFFNQFLKRQGEFYPLIFHQIIFET